MVYTLKVYDSQIPWVGQGNFSAPPVRSAMKAHHQPSGFSQEFSLPGERRVRSWAEADSALAELGKLERARTKLAAQRVRAVARIERQAERLEARAARLARGLEVFCRAQAVEAAGQNGERTTLLAAGRRSRRLVFGRVGFHRVHRLAVGNEERAVAALRRSRLAGKFLRVEAQLDRDALTRALLAARTNGAAAGRRLARAGIHLETRDAWFYELHPEAVARWG